MKYFEDIEIGEGRDVGSFTFTPEVIKRFAASYDPQPFHVDEEAAKQTHFGGLIASGWQTASVYIKLSVQQRARTVEEMRARGEPVAKTGPSPGFSNMRWVKPVYAGDTLRYANEVTDKRASRSRPGWGLIFTHTTATNQRGELVFEFDGCFFVERRSAAAS
jgi:acyl dehydratase